MARCRFACTPEGTRTPNLLVRSQTLYPIELRAQGLFQTLNINEFFFGVKWIREDFGGDGDYRKPWISVRSEVTYLRRPDTTGTFPSSTIRIRRVRGTIRIVVSCFEPGPTVK